MTARSAMPSADPVVGALNPHQHAIDDGKETGYSKQSLLALANAAQFRSRRYRSFATDPARPDLHPLTSRRFKAKRACEYRSYKEIPHDLQKIVANVKTG
jgi:hypothetical protein